MARWAAVVPVFVLMLEFSQVLFQSPRFETVVGDDKNLYFLVGWLRVLHGCCLVALLYATGEWYFYGVYYSHSISGGECRIPGGSGSVLIFLFVFSRA